MPLPGEPNGTSSADREVNKVALKLPPFWHKEADLWFLNIEAQFVLSGITQENTKYYAVISALDSDSMSHVSDLLRNPPASNPYQTLKQRLIDEFSESEQQRVKALLSHAILGDDKPSYLLRKMQQLADSKVGEGILKTLWLQRLPPETQAMLSIADGSLEKLAQMADKILEVTHPPTTGGG